MKNKTKKIMANISQIVQIIILFIAFSLPFIFNITGLVSEQYSEKDVDLSKIGWYLLLKGGNISLGILFLVYVLVFFRKRNAERKFNTANIYYDYPYSWYWFCSNILGYKTCNLERVPIYLQIKLVIRDTFSSYLVGENYLKKDEIIEVIDEHDHDSQIINIILSDTYPIRISQLPKGEDFNSKIWIIRDNKADFKRYYNEEYVGKVLEIVRNIEDRVSRVNIFATTNPKHTKEIIECAFKAGGRNNIQELYVFQQESVGQRLFGSKGHKIF